MTNEKASTAAEPVPPAEDHTRFAPPNAATADKISPPSAEPALEALQAHAPAAPFLNPVQAAQPAADRPEEPEQQVAVENTPDFLSEARESVIEQEPPQPRGFFSRLLRKADS